ncbi:MAG: ATP-binding protein [Bacteroidales bacterium]|nr:ATP-binding protein [Candidatus Latescibacterota bacterium]
MEETITMRFPSSYKWLNMIDLICSEVTCEMGFSHSSLNEISISVIEACTNALEHGNKSATGTSVKAVFHRKQDQLVVEVFDTGEGFDYKEYLQHIPDPSDIHNPRGRGIYIMKEMMDSLAFEKLPDRGMKVTLIKNVDEVDEK